MRDSLIQINLVIKKNFSGSKKLPPREWFARLPPEFSKEALTTWLSDLLVPIALIWQRSSFQNESN